MDHELKTYSMQGMVFLLIFLEGGSLSPFARAVVAKYDCKL